MPHEDVIRLVESKQAHILAVSVTLGGHILDARNLIAAVRASPATRDVKIMVGGQPFNRDPITYQSIGADMTASSARESVRVAMKAVA
jgi:methanogenic corrinoid protein MtbC1